jgi:hypothetical protein
MERMGDPEVRERLTAGAEAERERRSWARTVEGIAGLIDSVQPPAAAVADRDAG